jgi:exodeoxyribonuclease VII small subunit
MAEAKNKSITKLTFEDAMKELETIVHTLEQGNIELDNAIALYNRGIELKQHCSEKLSHAKLKVEKIIHEDGIAKDTEKSDLSKTYE